ncbi:penicillin-insensitive murein endopeptidase [Biformimicrobium ophioploci]|uniref:Penicillin-insensitive murein endopeptidase n=1 Tax=Biformimicrobium ophioploci TaxID=3036711 RepID=A0ABQ6LY52_9GAMM|nr:penicillin-insensitive murein endopeptidase [Microbulbifer sp. NKW57]GMG87033.1 penicillin-insensitive murein endopeptidase [Microbulbifer sp. NKW57]
MIPRKTPLLLLFAALVAGPAAANNPWEAKKNPTQRIPQTIGTYTNGCLDGAEQMPREGTGFQLVRTARNRHFGNPVMVRFLKDFAGNVHEAGLGTLLIGDIAMARGGPFTSGHASHQGGLDADIWFHQDPRAEERPLTDKERNSMPPTPLADAGQHKLIDKNWDDKYLGILRLASGDDRVERIFVHPTIKRQMCKRETGDKEWLRKVRPWWGHNYHFHVRLKCPEGQNNCKPQAPPKGDPCGGLKWWFSDDFYAILRGEKKKDPKPPKKPELPQQCKAVLAAP